MSAKAATGMSPEPRNTAHGHVIHRAGRNTVYAGMARRAHLLSIHSIYTLCNSEKKADMLLQINNNVGTWVSRTLGLRHTKVNYLV